MSRPQAKSFRRKAAAAASCHSHSSKAAHHGGRPARWPSRLMDGFRKMLVGLFSFPPRPPTVTFSVVHGHRHHGGGKGGGGEAPAKRSCSSNLHPLNAHYDEAIADCVEFFHKSARVDVRSRPPHFSTL